MTLWQVRDQKVLTGKSIGSLKFELNNLLEKEALLIDDEEFSLVGPSGRATVILGLTLKVCPK